MPGKLTAEIASQGQTDVVIVGAGPAGLALGMHLTRQGLPPRIIDRAGVGHSWERMPPALRLVSPWWTNCLRWRDMFRFSPFSCVEADDYARYLHELVRQERLSVATGFDVHSVVPDPQGGGFVLATGRGNIRTRVAVLCTGYFSSPASPEPPAPTDGSIPQMHAAEFPGAMAVRHLAGFKPVVIVGRRVSAGQIMVELARSGQAVALSLRSPLEFRRDGWTGAGKDALYYFYEELLLRARPELRTNSFPVMDGGEARALYEQGRIEIRPTIRRIQNGYVEFDDGTQLQAGLVINATGYTPALPGLPGTVELSPEDGLPLCRDWESVNTPGLYFLGLDNRRNYRSRTLRGIRTDAHVLAREIIARLS